MHKKYVGLHSFFLTVWGRCFALLRSYFLGLVLVPISIILVLNGEPNLVPNFGSHFLFFPFHVHKKSEYKTNVHNNIIAVRYCTSRLYVCAAYITAIGYGVDEAVWINVVETPIPYHVGGRHGWKKQPRTRTQRSTG
jgi:hypothetical protein